MMEGDAPGPVVLVVDDEPGVRELVSRIRGAPGSVR